jgi:hypothetical protein
MSSRAESKGDFRAEFTFTLSFSATSSACLIDPTISSRTLIVFVRVSPCHPWLRRIFTNPPHARHPKGHCAWLQRIKFLLCAFAVNFRNLGRKGNAPALANTHYRIITSPNYLMPTGSTTVSLLRLFFFFFGATAVNLYKFGSPGFFKTNSVFDNETMCQRSPSSPYMIWSEWL